MPNYCENDLFVEGKADDVNRFLDHIKGEETVFDFGAIIPYPENFKQMDEMARAFEKEIYAVSKDDPEREKKWKDIRAAYSAPEGCFWLRDGYNAGGYDWCINNWGTKWGALNAVVQTGDGSAMLHFETAWNPPLPVIKKAAALFPQLYFEIAYFECGMEFCGIATYDEVELSNERYHYSGRRGG
jgi:hypothetical protein